MKDLVIRVARQVQDENKAKINFLLGTMIELPRAALKAKGLRPTVSRPGGRRKTKRRRKRKRKTKKTRKKRRRRTRKKRRTKRRRKR